MNSGGHDPATGNFCMGVWTQTGNHSYKLNHYALSYDKTTGNLAVVVNIREQVSVAHGGGTFSARSLSMFIRMTLRPGPPVVRQFKALPVYIGQENYELREARPRRNGRSFP